MFCCLFMGHFGGFDLTGEEGGGASGGGEEQGATARPYWAWSKGPWLNFGIEKTMEVWLKMSCTLHLKQPILMHFAQGWWGIGRAVPILWRQGSESSRRDWQTHQETEGTLATGLSNCCLFSRQVLDKHVGYDFIIVLSHSTAQNIQNVGLGFSNTRLKDVSRLLYFEIHVVSSFWTQTDLPKKQWKKTRFCHYFSV